MPFLEKNQSGVLCYETVMDARRRDVSFRTQAHHSRQPQHAKYTYHAPLNPLSICFLIVSRKAETYSKT